MLIEIFMTLVLLCALAVVFILIKHLFGAIFKIFFGIVIIIILAGVYLSLDSARDTIVGNESIIIVAEGEELIKGFYKTASETYTEMSEEDFLKVRTEWNESKVKLNSSIKVIKGVSKYLINKSNINKSTIDKINSRNMFDNIKYKITSIIN